jgi:tRNA threonylcarbamoyladenosine dehydratase
MTSWLQRQASSRQTQITATAVISGAVVAGAILGFQAIRRREAVEELKASIPELNENHHAEQVGVTYNSHSCRT